MNLYQIMDLLAWSAKIDTVNRTEIADTIDNITSIYVIYFLFFLFVFGPIFAALIVFAYLTTIITVWTVTKCATYLERPK